MRMHPCCRRYVLVRADTLEAPSDSLLRSARRQLGEPSDSKVPLGTDATDAAAGAEPASVARSRPLSVVAEEQPEEGQQGQEAAQQQEQEGQQAGAAEAGQGAGQGGSAQPSAAALAAMAKQLSKLVRGWVLRLGPACAAAGCAVPAAAVQAAATLCKRVIDALTLITLMCPSTVPQDDGKARALLRRMGETGVREAVLEQLGAFDPDRAAACFALLGDDADEFDEAEEWDSASDEEERQQPSPGQPQQPQQQGQETEDAGAEDAEEAPSAQRVRSRRAAAAGARRAVKRAASAALSESEATETEAEPSRWVLCWLEHLLLDVESRFLE